MIYTVTLNPSIDFLVRLLKFNVGEVNRMEGDAKFPGGKGINVSRILKRIGENSTALGFLGGFTGKFILEKLKEEKIATEFVQISSDTRINVKIKADTESEINGAGPDITQAERGSFLKKLEVLKKEDIVVLAGSSPKSLGQDFYLEVIEKITSKGAEFVIDIEGGTLLQAIPSHPLVVKPNNHELSQIYGVKLYTVEELIPFGKQLLSDGAKHAMISMAGDGALLFTDEKIYFAPPIKGIVKNSVGAGDSMLAGFVGEYNNSRNPKEAFKMGVACGTATAFSEDLASSELIKEIYQKVKIVEYTVK